MNLLATVAIIIQVQHPVFVSPGSHPYRVGSASMEPTLSEGEIVVANRPEGFCGSTRPQIGDVVIVRRAGAPWVRRVVAGPGQSIRFEAGVPIIDDQPVVQEPLEDIAGNNIFGPESVRVIRETLHNGRQYRVYDFGVGKPLDDTPPIVVPPDHWFTVGDSRDNAIDSRVDGPTATTDLCGVVYRILESSDPVRIGQEP